jgi:hypothetical protein
VARRTAGTGTSARGGKASSSRARSIPVEHLRRECEAIETVVEVDGAATAEQLAAWRPGGAENPDRDAFAWLSYFKRLHRAHATGEGGAPRAQVIDAEVEQHLLAALEERPVRVELPEREGEESLHVYPKGLTALARLEGIDHVSGWLAEQVELLLIGNAAAHEEPFARALDELAFQQGLAAWIVCSEGSGLPYDPQQTPRPDLPARFRDLDPLVVPLVLRAHHECNGLRIAALRSIVSMPERAQERSRWSIFYASASSKMNRPASELMRDWSLAGLLAQLALAGQAEKDAYEESKRRAGRAADAS